MVYTRLFPIVKFSAAWPFRTQVNAPALKAEHMADRLSDLSKATQAMLCENSPFVTQPLERIASV